MHPRRTTTRLTAFAVFLAVALSACGGSPGEQLPTGAIKVTGAISLPAGHGLDLAALEVVTPYGSYPVAADGKYTALVMKGADTEVGVETTAGTLVLLGVSEGASVPLSLTTTAEALLYYLVGGMWLPPEQQDTVRELLRGRGEAVSVTAHLQRLLLAGGNGLAAPDTALLEAIDAAHASLLSDAAVVSSVGRLAICPAGILPAAADLSVIIQGGTTPQAGAMLLHNPNGIGVVAHNELRRPAALLAYEVSWEDVDHNLTAVEPPVLVERVEVPATGNLEFFAALGDIVTGGAPWSPVLSPPLILPGHEGASMTQYELVLIGPSLTSDTLPIWDDPRFLSLHSEWEDVAFEKSIELFLNELLIPLIEVYALGKVAKFDAAQLKKARDRVRIIYDKHLLELGVFLKADPLGGYAAGLKFVIEELAVNKTLRSDMITMLTEALGTSASNKLSVEALDKRLAVRASASAIALAVETVLVGGDVTKIMADLATTPSVASWQAEAMPARFIIDPPLATITRDYAMAKFTVEAIGDVPDASFRFRWSTSGQHGVLDDLMGGEGVVVDTTSAEIYYFHNDPVVLNANDIDTILLEVFVVEPGASEIPAAAKPIGKGQAVVKGEDEEDMCVWECDEDGLCYIHCP